MENNITKPLIKKMWKRCVTLPLNSLQRGRTLPFWCLLSQMTPPPSEAPALPPKKKRTFRKREIEKFPELH